jgi:phenylpyruvate tautomerase PptA (4-oxalocrotonate tautomerase family)
MPVFSDLFPLERTTMPVITCVLIEGYSDKTRRLLEQRLTDAARYTTGAVWDAITVMINELPFENYMRGRVEKIPAKAPTPASDIVRSFLTTMESRDLEGAKSYLADGFKMTFPGNAQFNELEELIDWSRERYQSARKEYQKFDESFGPEGVTVYCFGTLSGMWLDGTQFSGVRFIDRFSVVDGKLADQRVWNDMAEVGK